MKPIKFEDYAHKYDYLTMERNDGILLLKIHAKNAPDTPCVWSGQPHEELSFAFNDIARDYDNQCVILTGGGDAFCADMFGGAVAREWHQPRAITEEVARKSDLVGHDARQLLLNHLSIEVPMIAAVNGPALIHAELAVLCDIVICSDNASFQDAPHFPNGVVPGDGVHVVWPLVLGPNRGRYFLLTGQKLSASEALNLGVVSEVMAKDKLMPRAWELAREICKRPTLVRRYARVAMTQPLKQAMLGGLGYGIALESLAMFAGIGLIKK